MASKSTVAHFRDSKIWVEVDASRSIEVGNVSFPDCDTWVRVDGEHGPVVTRLLALVNVALIPYVAWKFPGEARAYTRRSFEAVLRGK